MAAESTTDKGTGDEVTKSTEQLPDVIGTSKLDENDLSAVLEAVHDAHSKWHGIGLQLRLQPPVLRGIEQQYSNTEDTLREMLGKWLKQVTPVPTWAALIGALQSKTVNEPGLAKHLIEKYHIILPHVILIHAVSDVDARQKQILGRLQATTKEVDSQLDSYEAILQQRKEADPSDEAPEAAQEIHMQRGQSHESGLKTDPVRALHIQFKQLMSRTSSLESRMSGVSGLNPTAIPEGTETKEPDALKGEMDHLRARNSEQEEELHSLRAKLVELGEKNTLLSTEKEDLQKEMQSLNKKIVDKNDEIAKRAEDVAEKAKDVAKKSADYNALLEEKQQLEKEVEKLTEENKLLKSQRTDDMPTSPEPSDCPETSIVDQ